MLSRIRSSPGLHFLGWKLGLLPALTQTTLAEQESLVRHARGRRRLLEIGVWHGANTRRLRAAMAPDGLLIAVDPFPRNRFGFSWERGVARGEVSCVQNGTVTFLEMTSVEAIHAFKSICGDQLDFAFIDGEHSYEGLQSDWTAWSPRMAIGGLVALHDSRSTPIRPIDHVGSVRFTREHILNDPRFRVIDLADSLTILERVTQSAS